MLSWSMIAIALGVTFFGLGFGKFKIGKVKKEEEFTKQHIERELSSSQKIEEYPKNSRNLIIPIIVLLVSTIFFFWWTGRKESETFFGAFSAVDFNISIFAGALLTIFVASIYYILQKISLAEIEAHIIIGAEKVMGLIMILVLSWALTIITEELGFNDLIGEDVIRRIPQFMIPASIFIIASIISYTIGSSWATWALLMPLAITFAVNSGIDISIMGY